MALFFIDDDTITGDNTEHTARRVPGQQQEWEVSWLPGQRLDRNAAITAMVLADMVGSGAVEANGRLWPHVQGWAAEVGLTTPDALARLAQPPRAITGRHDDAALSDPEAAG
jgi:hypothetical protein